MPNIYKNRHSFFPRNILIFGVISYMVVVCHKVSLAAIEDNPPLTQYQVIEGRNIFRPTDDAQPKMDTTAGLQTPSSEKKSENEPMDGYSLTGIIQLRGQYKAIIEKKSEEKGYYLMLNDAIDDYTLVDIQYNTVTLEKDGKRVFLKLNIPAPSKDPTPSRFVQPITQTEEPEEDTQIQDINAINYRQDVMRSIRMGIPNGKK